MDAEEAERWALIVCRAATFQYRVIPKRAGNIWYVESSDGLKPLFEVVCWIQPEEADGG